LRVTGDQPLIELVAANAIPALANIDPPRMFQFQVRFLF
jgi:hypothetical protein